MLNLRTFYKKSILFRCNIIHTILFSQIISFHFVAPVSAATSFSSKFTAFCPANISTFSLTSKVFSSSTSASEALTETETEAQSQSQSAMKKIPLTKLTSYANSYAAANGLQVESKNSNLESSSSSYQCAPISLLPNAFPCQSFQNAQSLAPYFNLLVDKVSRDAEFLNDTLGGEHGVISKDEYTKKLLELYNDIYVSSNDNLDDMKPNFAKEADRLGIQRSDYMLNSGTEDGEFELKQVELNTIAASFAGLAVNVAKLHQSMTDRFSSELKDWLEMNQKAVMGENYVLPSSSSSSTYTVGVPNNPALERLPFAMKVAHERYVERFVTKSKNENVPAVILFVVQEGETNTVDQRMLEFKLWEEYKIPVVRMSLTKANNQLQMDEENGTLYILPEESIDGKISTEKYQVSVAYFRAGYAPTDYPDGYDGIEWESRDMIERSRATKCPSLGYHLAGTKKVQQQLARPGVLERFFDGKDEESSNTVGKMREAFAGLYSLGDDAVQEDYSAVKDVLSGAEGKYVLKPQREGGGYNYYGDSLLEKIRENVEEGDGSLKLGEDLAEFILMQRLFPPKQRAVLLRSSKVEGSGQSISEFGCFGTIVQTHDGKATLHNEYSGFLLRTKFENVDEGGVASGFATLSSPYLC